MVEDQPLRSANVEVDHWHDQGWATVLVKVARCSNCSYCKQTPEPEDFLAMPDPGSCCARCLHGACPGAAGL